MVGVWTRGAQVYFSQGVPEGHRKREDVKREEGGVVRRKEVGRWEEAAYQVEVEEQRVAEALKWEEVEVPPPEWERPCAVLVQGIATQGAEPSRHASLMLRVSVLEAEWATSFRLVEK